MRSIVNEPPQTGQAGDVEVSTLLFHQEIQGIPEGVVDQGLEGLEEAIGIHIHFLRLLRNPR